MFEGTLELHMIFFAMAFGAETPERPEIREDRCGLFAKPLTRNACSVRALVKLQEEPRESQPENSWKEPDQRAQMVSKAPVSTQSLHVPNDAHRVTYVQVCSPSRARVHVQGSSHQRHCPCCACALHHVVPWRKMRKAYPSAHTGCSCP